MSGDTMADTERLFKVLGDIQNTVTNNHTEVVQRLTRLETQQHSPEDCKRTLVSSTDFATLKESVERHEQEHRDEDREERRYRILKKVVDYAVKGAVAAGLLYGGSKYGG